jgi:hypothetical protein
MAFVTNSGSPSGQPIQEDAIKTMLAIANSVGEEIKPNLTIEVTHEYKCTECDLHLQQRNRAFTTQIHIPGSGDPQLEYAQVMQELACLFSPDFRPADNPCSRGCSPTGKQLAQTTIGGIPSRIILGLSREHRHATSNAATHLGKLLLGQAVETCMAGQRVYWQVIGALLYTHHALDGWSSGHYQTLEWAGGQSLLLYDGAVGEKKIHPSTTIQGQVVSLIIQSAPQAYIQHFGPARTLLTSLPHDPSLDDEEILDISDEELLPTLSEIGAPEVRSPPKPNPAVGKGKQRKEAKSKESSTQLPKPPTKGPRTRKIPSVPGPKQTCLGFPYRTGYTLRQEHHLRLGAGGLVTDARR